MHYQSFSGYELNTKHSEVVKHYKIKHTVIKKINYIPICLEPDFSSAP